MQMHRGKSFMVCLKYLYELREPILIFIRHIKSDNVIQDIWESIDDFMYAVPIFTNKKKTLTDVTKHAVSNVL